MRILHVSHAFPPTFGGVESHLWDITKELARRGESVRCLVGGPPARDAYGPVVVDRYRELEVGYLTAQRSRVNRFELDAGLRAELRDRVSPILRDFQPEIVHAHNAHHFAPELALALFDSGDGVPLFNSVHDRVGEHIYPEVLDYPWNQIIYASRYLQRQLPSKAEATTVHLGIDLNAFAAEGPREPRLLSLRRPIVFHPARLLRWKGCDVGVRALARVRAELGSGTLVLCASENIVDDASEVRTYRAELEGLAHELGVSDGVTFMGFSRPEIAAAYRAADLIWYPTTDDEPLGLVPLEAMACGVPLVVSASGGMLETVDDAETGLIVAKGDPVELAAAAVRLLTDAAMRATVVAGGRTKSHAFSNERYVENLRSLYQRHAVGSRAAGARTGHDRSLGIRADASGDRQPDLDVVAAHHDRADRRRDRIGGL
jgi:glycogen synthase